jgi:hypothetical protein
MRGVSRNETRSRGPATVIGLRDFPSTSGTLRGAQVLQLKRVEPFAKHEPGIPKKEMDGLQCPAYEGCWRSKWIAASGDRWRATARENRHTGRGLTCAD